MDGFIYAEQDRDLDRAGGMEPPIGVTSEVDVGLGVVDGNSERARAGASLEGVESDVERGVDVLVGSRRNG
jgi:hypothetical protein